jgi:gliding motility-associated-like protein
MKKVLNFLLSLGFLCVAHIVAAQNIQFKIELLSDNITYRVSMKPDTTWTAPNNNTLGLQVTLLAPTGTLSISNLTNINGNWEDLPAIVAPTENPIKDYFVIYMTSSANLPYAKDVETPLFTFQRTGVCNGSIELINNNTDPFIEPNSQSLNVGNYITTRGGGGSSNNLWRSNYGGAALCPNVVRSCEIEYKLIPLSTGKYQVSMIPKVSWAGVLATTATQQVTIRVPTGGFQVANLTNLVTNVRYMQNSRFDAPTENPTKDYIIFNLQTLGTRNLSYVANVEVPLFTFENSGSCGNGNVELMNNATDAFRTPNSRAANVGQQLTNVGGGVDVPICLNTSYLTPCTQLCPNPSVNILGDDGAFCSGKPSNLGIVSNYTDFQWTPTTGLSCSNCANPQVRITADTRYIVTAKNPQTGCPVRDTLTLYVLPVPVITGIDTIPNISCTSGKGSIVIRATVSDNSALEYSIDNGLTWQDSNVFINVSGGTYTLCARTKLDRCVITFTGNPVFFRPATPPSVSVVTKTDVTDCSLNNGSIRITATGNTSALKYSINGGTTFSDSPIFNNLAAGNYTIVVTNADASCSTNYPTTITILGKTPPIIQSLTVEQSTDCTRPTGTITVVATSGVAPLQYSINNGQTWQSSPIFTNIGLGNHTISVRNADSSCLVTRSTTINPCQIYTLQGTAFKTCSATALRDGQAQIMQNIIVILRGSANNILRTKMTDSRGLYQFDSLSTGDYTLTFGLPTGLAFSTQNVGTNRSIDSDVDATTGAVSFNVGNNNGVNSFVFDAGYYDVEAPVISLTNPILRNVRRGDTLTYACHNSPIFNVSDITATDNCDSTIVATPQRGGITLQFVDIAQKIGNCPRDGYTVLMECVWRATDYCGNRSTFKIFVKITDNQAPTFRGVPANITVTGEANIPVLAVVTASDNCSTGIVPTFQQTQQNTAQLCEYLITRTWTAIDECGNITRAAQQITVQKNPSDCSPRLCSPTGLSRDSVVVTNACGAQPKACINLPMDILANYTLAINNQSYTGQLEGCRYDTAISYSYFSLINRGASAPFHLSNWVIGGQSFSVQNIPSIQALVDTMNRIDPDARWLLDARNYCITRTNYYQYRNYGDMRINYSAGGSYAILQVNRTLMPYGTNLNINRGRSVITLTNNATGCLDSVVVYATCLTNSRVEVALLKGQTKETCLDLSQMLGSRFKIEKMPPLSKNVQFSLINGTSCILINALNGTDKDSMIYVVTDEFGIHDTTFIIAKVQVQLAVNQAKVFDDLVTTYKNKHIVLDVLKNDSLNSNQVTMAIVKAPNFGKAYKTSDFRIFYEPQLDYCNNQKADELQYSICTTNGCDTAKVNILVLCDSLRFNTGFSPNNDGINDYFTIEGIELYPLSTLRIYNRWGVKVFQTTGYKNNWEGTFQGKHLPDGTYFYQLNTGRGADYTGYLQINR